MLTALDTYINSSPTPLLTSSKSTVDYYHDEQANQAGGGVPTFTKYQNL
jgi:hypothetical protein